MEYHSPAELPARPGRRSIDFVVASLYASLAVALPAAFSAGFAYGATHSQNNVTKGGMSALALTFAIFSASAFKYGYGKIFKP